MPIRPPIQPEPETARRYAYHDAQGRYWAGHPGPGAVISADEYDALPPYVKQVFRMIETPTREETRDADTTA